MENQAVKGVLDLSMCSSINASPLILPGNLAEASDQVAKEALDSSGSALLALLKLIKDSAKVSPEDWDFANFYGFNPPRPVGPYMAIQLHKNTLSETIEIAQETRNNQKWISNVGRVIALGSACFKGEQFKHWNDNDIPKVGEWVTYKPNSGPVVKFRGIDVVIMFDDSITMKIENPDYVTRD